MRIFHTLGNVGKVNSEKSRAPPRGVFIIPLENLVSENAYAQVICGAREDVEK